MPYEVLTQKWRPQRFSEVVGQNPVVTTLKNQLLNDRIGHAYLFSGPRGIGKTTIARILAKAVNCKNREIETEFSHGISPEPCNKCETCEAISNGTSFDVIEMDAASNRGIDEIRSLRERVKLAPSLCQYKVYIIDEAHMLTTEAFNALLKTLEEPPKHVIFILITTERHKIPKTILSRCQDFEFWYLSHSQITSHLKKLCASEGFSVTEEGLGLIAQKSEGCLRDAQNLLEQLFAASLPVRGTQTGGESRNIDLDDVSGLLGFGSISLLSSLIEQIIDRNTLNCLKIINQLAEQGADLSQCLRTLIADFRSLRLLSVGSQLEEIIDVSETRLDWMKSQAKNISLDRISKIVKILMKAESDIKQHGYELINFESALIEACSIQEGIKLAEAFDKLTEIQGMLEEMSRSQKSVVSEPTKPAVDSKTLENASIEEKDKRLVYHLPESFSELSSEKIVNRLINWLNKNGNSDLTSHIEQRAEVKVENSQLILKFSSDLWYNLVKDESSVIAEALEKIDTLSEIGKQPIDVHKDSDKDIEPSARFISEDRFMGRIYQEPSEFSDVDDDTSIVDDFDNQLSKHKLFDKASRDKIISHALKKFKADLIEVKPK